MIKCKGKYFSSYQNLWAYFKPKGGLVSFKVIKGTYQPFSMFDGCTVIPIYEGTNIS